jgi:hypothetical protein
MAGYQFDALHLVLWAASFFPAVAAAIQAALAGSGGQPLSVLAVIMIVVPIFVTSLAVLQSAKSQASVTAMKKALVSTPPPAPALAKMGFQKKKQ